MSELGAGLEDREEQGYFAVLPAPPGLPGGILLLQEAAALARAAPIGAEVRAAVEEIISGVERGVARVTVETIKVSETAIVEHIQRSRVRPEISAFGFMVPKKRLEDGIKSEALGLGGVGIGSIAELDTVVGTDGRPFWRTQEYGSDHNVGRIVYGLFQPGGAAPSATEFRKHPVFEPGSGGAMVIRRPIPARHFMRDGTGEAEGFRARELGEVEDLAVGEIKLVRASLPAAL